mgnify:CR=1 FL=1
MINCDESYAMTVMRRMMYRIGEKLARKNHCLALVKWGKYWASCFTNIR